MPAWRTGGRATRNTFHCARVLVPLTCALVGLSSTAALAQADKPFPTRPIRLVVPQAPGGATDIQARLIADRLTRLLGQQVVVDNRSGGGAAGIAAFTTVMKAAPDGHTLLAVVPSFTFAPVLYRNYPIDPLRDFVPVSLATRAPYLLVVNAGNPSRSVRELIQFGRAQPDKLTFGAGNTGSGTHLVTAWFIAAAGIQATYVPYRSTGMATLDLTSGRLSATFANVLSAGPLVKSGKLHVLGISTAQRSKTLPELPTIAEQGVPGYNASTFHGYAVPAATPTVIVNTLSAALARAVKSPELADRIAEDGGEPVGSTPAAFRQFIAGELRVWREVVSTNGIKVE